MPIEKILFFLQNGVQYKWIQKITKKRNHYEMSDWYIFDHCNGCLAIYHRHGGVPCLDYETVREMLNTDDWSYLEQCMGHPITQKDVLIRVIKTVLDYYDEEE